MKSRRTALLGIVNLLGILPLLALTCHWAAAAELSAPDCAALTETDLPDTEIHRASLIRAGGFTPPGADKPLPLPGFCRVEATSQPAVKFEVWLPVENWNGKFQGVGNGGMAGSISYGSMALGLGRGYAVASTDTGHTTGDIPFNASWALGRPDLIEDFGHRALHLTTVHGKSVTTAFYGTEPGYSYYVGCSKGGQQGLMEAQRYPADYDGLLVGNPANDWTRFYAGAHLWYSLATLAKPESYLPPSKLPVLGAAVNAACDTLDGIEDGVLLDPRDCSFNPASLTCPAGTDGDACLTEPQVEAVIKIWSGVKNSAGELIFPGLMPGGEAAPGGWSRWVTGSEPFKSLHWLGGEGFFRYFVFDDPDWDFRSFDYDKDLELALNKVGHAVDASNPDLSALAARGGKLLMYHGWSDPDISPLGSIRYYEQVLDTLGQRGDRATDLGELQSFFRLFMVPGLGHCRGGPGPDQFDGLSALEAWVEKDVAPVQIIASKLDDDGSVIRTLPLCPYPAEPVWDGKGDPFQAASFNCEQ